MRQPTSSISSLLSSAKAGRPGTPTNFTAGDAQQDFASIMARQNTGPAARLQEPDAQARAAAEEFVAISMVQPILAEARESTMAAGPFEPSSAERQFRAMQDATLAQRLTRAAHFPLVERLARDLQKSVPSASSSSTIRP